MDVGLPLFILVSRQLLLFAISAFQSQIYVPLSHSSNSRPPQTPPELCLHLLFLYPSCLPLSAPGSSLSNVYLDLRQVH